MTGSVYWFICSREAEPRQLPTIAASQTAFNRDVANALASTQKARRNVGDLLPRPNANAVPDHLLCDGSAVARTSFPQLFAAIGTEWGAGDGVASFNLPNLVGTELPVAAEAPAQTVTGSTVSTGATVTAPSTAGQTGGSTGGNVPSGGRPDIDENLARYYLSLNPRL